MEFRSLLVYRGTLAKNAQLCVDQRHLITLQDEEAEIRRSYSDLVTTEQG